MSPEQAKGESVDYRCDLFSLGSVLYHLASGRPAFDGSNLTATLIAVANKDPEPIETVRPELDADLARLIMQLLNKEVDQRPQSAADVVQSLRQIEQKLQARRVSEMEATQQQPFASTLASPALDRVTPAKERRPLPVKPILVGGGLAAVLIGAFLAIWAAVMPTPLFMYSSKKLT